MKLLCMEFYFLYRNRGECEKILFSLNFDLPVVILYTHTSLHNNNESDVFLNVALTLVASRLG